MNVMVSKIHSAAESTIALVMAVGAGALAIAIDLTKVNEWLQTVTFILGILILIPVAVVRWYNLIHYRGKRYRDNIEDELEN